MTASPSSSPASPLGAEEVHGALERVLHSESFRKTPSLRHLLEYLVTKAADGHVDQIKESVVAIDVFSRGENFDGRIDNIVRVQVHRLRKLLDTYCAEEGKDDRIWFSIPKGSYVPQVTFREHPAPTDSPATAGMPESVAFDARVVTEQGSEPARGNPALRWTAIFFVATAVLSLAFLQGMRIGSRGARQSIPPAVDDLWRGIFAPKTNVITAYTNPAFLRIGRDRMFFIRYGGPLSAPSGAEIELGPNDPYIDRHLLPKGEKLYFSDNWTGTGEVLAVNRLTLLSTQFHSNLQVMPSRALTPRDMQDSNVVFLGSPSMNGTLAQLHTEANPFETMSDGRIVVRRPVSGEQASYKNMFNPGTGELVGAYSLFSVLPGIGSGRILISSAGLGTAATWAGIDFATTASGAAQLERALNAANGGSLPRFYQAIIRTEVIKGTPSNPSLVTVRVVKAN